MSTPERGSLDEVARLLAVLIRQGVETQQEAILAMHAVELENSRIADLLGTSAATVRATVNKSRGS